MKFKETFLIDDVRALKGIKKTALVKIIKTNAKKERKEYVVKAFEDQADKAEKLKGCVVVATMILMPSNNEFCSETAITNIIKLDIQVETADPSRTYDQNHY